MEQEQLEKTLAKTLGNLPEKTGSLKKYVNTLVDIIHYYFDRFGPYLPSHMRKEWTKLALQSDILAIDMESTRNRVEALESHIRKKTILGSRPGRVKKRVEELERELERLEAAAEELRKQTKKLLQELAEYVEKTGIE